MAFLQQQLFTTPRWLLDKKLYSLAGVGDLNTISSVQGTVLSRLMNGATLEKLLQFEALEGAKAYTASELLTDLRKGIWKEIYLRQPVDIYRRNLQKIHAEKLISLVKPPAPQPSSPGMRPVQPSGLSNTSDALSLVKGQVRTLASEIRQAVAVTRDGATRLHLQDVAERLDDALKAD